ncbi:hypothetical protein ACEQ8H_000590 [Pleosporales sp. CAS-2024a]
MPAFAHLLKTMLVPLLLAALLYLLLALLILPFVRRHRTRYTQYLPLAAPVPEFSASWRTSLSDALCHLFAPAAWAASHRLHVAHATADDDVFDDDEGEGMVGFDPVDDRRREALEQRRTMVQEEPRLGRDLEEGFKDDSDDDHDPPALRSTHG